MTQPLTVVESVSPRARIAIDSSPMPSRATNRGERRCAIWADVGPARNAPIASVASIAPAPKAE